MCIRDRPHTGEIEFQLLDSPNGHENLKIGYVPQHMNIEKDTPASVYDLMASFLSKTPVFLRKNKKLYGELKEQLAIFEAEDLIDKQIGALSGGELQRVLLSMAIIPVPNLLLLDEPVSGIDQNGMELFYQKINHLKENYDLSIILISHDLEYVRKYADQVVLLDTTVIKQGTVKEVFSSEEFRRVFGTAGYTAVSYTHLIRERLSGY